MKPDFSKAYSEATNLLLEQSFDDLHIDVRKFNFTRKKIIIDSVQRYANTVRRPVSDFICEEINGCCVLKKRGYSIILYYDTVCCEERKHWGIIHELGHIYLEHTDDSEKSEIEANFFAAQVVMPEQVLRYLRDYKGSLNSAEIYKYFNASQEAVKKRIKTLNKSKPYYHVTENDRALIDKFKPIIQSEFSVNEVFACAIKSH